jgi:lipoprotein NlpI
MKTKEFDEAVKYYNNSLRIDPEEPTTYCNRALAFFRLKSKFNIKNRI